ncbi:MAG: GatB/YqeY domain-containing protein [Deltaproteobacteria bacterium]|nr:GatB/YqeY domain-containing protein [Deltaproteobacteria bacterium]
MSLNHKIVEDLKAAMKEQDRLRLSCLRMLKTSMKNRQVEEGRDLKDEEIRSVISSMVRKGKDAVKGFREGGREDLALKEEQELEIFYEYLPKQLAKEEIEGILQEVISELSADSPGDLGKVMKAAMARMAGQAQGKEVNEIARKLLSR